MGRDAAGNKVALVSLIFLFSIIVYSVSVNDEINVFSNNLIVEAITLDLNNTRFLIIPLGISALNFTIDLTNVQNDSFVFFDNFNRPDGVVGNGWAFVNDDALGNVTIVNNRMSISPSTNSIRVNRSIGPGIIVSFQYNITGFPALSNSNLYGYGINEGGNRTFWCGMNLDATSEFRFSCKDHTDDITITNRLEANVIYNFSFINIDHDTFTYDFMMNDTLFDNGGNHFRFFSNSTTERILMSKSRAGESVLIDNFKFANASVTDLQIEVGDIDGVPEFNKSGDLGNVTGVNLNASNINQILIDGCICTNCTISGPNCLIPVNFHSSTKGDLEYSNMSLTTIFGLDQCESFNTSAFNFTIRDENTGALVNANATFSIDFFVDPSNVNTLITIREGNNTYPFCKFPSYANLTGNIGATLTAPGRESSTFSRVNVGLKGIFTAFMLPVSASVQQVLYIIVDEAFARVEDARMVFQRIINGTLQTTFEGNSDFQGQVVLNQDSNSVYTIELNASGFPLKTFNLQPILSTYTIKLTEGGTDAFNNAYSGFRYKIIPSGNIFNISQDFINFTFIVEGNSLEFWGMNLTRHTFECIPADCSNVSTSPTGGNVTVRIRVNTTGRFYTELFFKQTGQELIRINAWPNDGIIAVRAARSILATIEQIRENTSPNVRAVLVASTQSIFVAVASSVGLIGFPLMVIATFILIFFSLPVIGFINPIFGLFMALAGLFMYVMSQRNG